MYETWATTPPMSDKTDTPKLYYGHLKARRTGTPTISPVFEQKNICYHSVSAPPLMHALTAYHSVLIDALAECGCRDVRKKVTTCSLNDSYRQASSPV